MDYTWKVTEIRNHDQPDLQGSELKGMGGLLVLPAIGLVVTPIGVTSALLDMGQIEPRPVLVSYLMLAYGLELILNLIAAFAFFTKKSIAPKLVIAWLIGWIVIIVLFAPSLRMIMPILWITYFTRSRRVKNTFVREI
jgi:hypothetical protein